MPASTPKTSKAATKKAEPSHPTYKDMICDAISTLKERNGSSRQALKKYIQSNFKELKNFDTQFNNAVRRGVEKGEFIQPKGPSGPVKLNIKKKETEKKPKATTKDTATEKPKKAAVKPKKVAVEKEVKPKETKQKRLPLQRALHHLRRLQRRKSRRLNQRLLPLRRPGRLSQPLL